jgi:hypothetical protein
MEIELIVIVLKASLRKHRLAWPSSSPTPESSGGGSSGAGISPYSASTFSSCVLPEKTIVNFTHNRLGMMNDGQLVMGQKQPSIPQQRILHDVRLHNQLQAYQSSKLINYTSIVKSLVGISFRRWAKYLSTNGHMSLFEVVMPL